MVYFVTMATLEQDDRTLEQRIRDLAFALDTKQRHGYLTGADLRRELLCEEPPEMVLTYPIPSDTDLADLPQPARAMAESIRIYGYLVERRPDDDSSVTPMPTPYAGGLLRVSDIAPRGA